MYWSDFHFTTSAKKRNKAFFKHCLLMSGINKNRLNTKKELIVLCLHLRKILSLFYHILTYW